MRRLLAMLCVLLMLPLVAASRPALADPYTDTAAIDELFAQLRVARNAVEADELSQQIWGFWFSPNDADLDRRMEAASSAIAVGDVISALAVLDAVVETFPDYAEGWNQRATVNYMIGNLDASLADIDKVLAIEPRHYGALSGRVLIYLRQDRHDEALRDMLAALAIHPYLSERRLFPELAQDVTHV